MRRIAGKERDDLILAILNRIDADTQVIGAPERTAAWERGWQEALARFKANPCEESLIPAFIHNDQPVRWEGDFWMPDEEYNELSHVRVLQARLAACLQDCPTIAEFGSGTGFNLVALWEQFHSKEYHAFDFSLSAVALADEIRKLSSVPVFGHLFDMKKPDAALSTGTGVFTFGAIEQLAGQFHAFMGYLIEQRPRIVVHIEPIAELYDPTSLLDALALRFHRKRGYTEGLLPWLQVNPSVELLQVEKSAFGSLMHSGYNLIAWRPR